MSGKARIEVSKVKVHHSVADELDRAVKHRDVGTVG